MVNWDRPDWGGHVHMDTHGSWLDAEQTDTDGGAA